VGTLRNVDAKVTKKIFKETTNQELV